MTLNSPSELYITHLHGFMRPLRNTNTENIKNPAFTSSQLRGSANSIIVDQNSRSRLFFRTLFFVPGMGKVTAVKSVSDSRTIYTRRYYIAMIGRLAEERDCNVLMRSTNHNLTQRNFRLLLRRFLALAELDINKKSNPSVAA